jgi:hypothetical protein
VPDHPGHRGLPQRWLLPPPPRTDPARSRWHALPYDDRRRLAHVAAAGVAGLTPEDREVVTGLASARLATSWRLLAAAPLLGWLVLMTIWGFGRASYPDAADRYLLVGATLGAVTWLLAAVAVAGRLRRAREVLAAVTDRGSAAGQDPTQP